MELAGSTEIQKAAQDIVNATDSDDAAVTPESGDNTNVEAGFDSFMRTALGGAGKTEVNEEELFAALIEERLAAHSPEAAEHYSSAKAGYLNSLRRADGYVSVEEAAVKALEDTVASGAIDIESAELINGHAFAAAQLDSNTDSLFDSFGSEGDTTVAVSDMEAALLASRTMMDEIEAGTATVGPRALDAPMTTSVGGGSSVGGGGASSGPSPSGSQEMDGQGGFLWKPESESNGKLVVLLPTELRGMLDRVEIHASLPPDATTLIEEGVFATDEHNGNRPHYRFEQAGEGYGSDVHVVAYKSDGETLSWDIVNGADRHD